MFRDDVMSRYAEDLAGMDRTEFEDFVSSEADRLTQQMVNLQAELEDSVRAETRERVGRPLDYQESATVITRARQQAHEMVRHQLWEGYLPPTTQTTPSESASAEPEVVVSEETEALVERVWPQAEPAWQVSAEMIVQARRDDGLPVPTGPDHPLVAMVAALVEEDLAHDAEVLAHARRTSR